MMKKLILAIAVLVSTSTVTQAANQFKRAKHPSMKACWNYVQSQIGNDYRIVTDRPDKVEGLFGQNQMFSCKVVSTGTQGTYVQSTINVGSRR
ncbi:TPA: hypothetical protein NNR36_004549 [Salmonella enterica]|uniref:hypothetical protein n=1 Tax=Acinetobacter baumannii TaxID=470 RepID=UPI003AF9D883|nr:hypothetical protein [Salmonella enterica]HCH8780909.1 hypothetical protein [Salmonella enterica]HCH9129654.1 hypothetical protein [Salmonella enterica]